MCAEVFEQNQSKAFDGSRSKPVQTNMSDDGLFLRSASYKPTDEGHPRKAYKHGLVSCKSQTCQRFRDPTFTVTAFQ